MSSTAPHRILVVDDDRELGNAIARDLEDRGFRVLLARDGLEAWQLLRHGAQRIDAVVTDIGMPILDGLGLAEHIRGMPNPPPVIFISGREQPPYIPAQPFLLKPVDPDELATLLRQLL